jgi:hypothetical protein
VGSGPFGLSLAWPIIYATVSAKATAALDMNAEPTRRWQFVVLLFHFFHLKKVSKWRKIGHMVSFLLCSC